MHRKSQIHMPEGHGSAQRLLFVIKDVTVQVRVCEKQRFHSPPLRDIRDM